MKGNGVVLISKNQEMQLKWIMLVNISITLRVEQPTIVNIYGTEKRKCNRLLDMQIKIAGDIVD